jgi:RNA polymerase sigma-70 factor (ECF subfamily)
MEASLDIALIRRVGSGDENALAALYDRHGRTAYGVALRVLRDPHLAEDAVQEAFLALWRTAASFDPSRSAPSTWIHVLVHRRAVDLVRREARRATVDMGETEVSDPTPGTDETAMVRERRAHTQAALAQLGPAHRTVLELAYYGGLTQSEIASRLEIPLGTVKSRTSFALARLGEHLAEPPSAASLQAVSTP